MKDIILRQEDIDRFTDHLTKLVEKAQLELAVLVHKDGHLLASQARLPEGGPDTTALAALVSANFSSTMAVANLIGETEFTTQFHTGNSKSIYISMVDEDTFLASIFVNAVPSDSVKVYTGEYSVALRESLQLLYENEMDGFGDELPLDETIQVSREDFEGKVSERSGQADTAEIIVQPTAPARHVLPRVLPHTVKRSARPVVRDERDVFYIELPDDYYHHKIKEVPA